jgi:hypothetical protein
LEHSQVTQSTTVIYEHMMMEVQQLVDEEMILMVEQYEPKFINYIIIYYYLLFKIFNINY